jgi:hypothetical protein
LVFWACFGWANHVLIKPANKINLVGLQVRFTVEFVCTQLFDDIEQVDFCPEFTTTGHKQTVSCCLFVAATQATTAEVGFQVFQHVVRKSHFSLKLFSQLSSAVFVFIFWTRHE